MWFCLMVIVGLCCWVMRFVVCCWLIWFRCWVVLMLVDWFMRVFVWCGLRLMCVVLIFSLVVMCCWRWFGVCV